MSTTRKKLPPNPLNAEQLALFDSYVKEWQVILGLQGWRIERGSKKIKNMAEVECDYVAQLAVYRVGDFGTTVVTPESIESVVIHELSHIMLYGLVNQVAIELVGEALEAEEHKVVHTIERLLLKLKSHLLIKGTL